MDLFLVPNNPTQTTLISSNGVAHYHIETSRIVDGVSMTRIMRPTVQISIPNSTVAGTGRVRAPSVSHPKKSLENHSEAGPSHPQVLHRRFLADRNRNDCHNSVQLKKEHIVAEIEWKSWDAPTIIRSHASVLGGLFRDAASAYEDMRSMKNLRGWRIQRGGLRRDKGKGKEKEKEKSGWYTDDMGWTGRSWQKGREHPSGPRKRSDPDAAPVAIRANKLLYRKGQFSSSRYFIAENGVEYRWKNLKGAHWALTRAPSTVSTSSSTPSLTHSPTLTSSSCPQTQPPLVTYASTSPSTGLFAGSRKCVLQIHPECDIDINLVILTWVISEKKRRDQFGGDGTKLTPHDDEAQGDGGGGSGGDGAGS